MSEPSNASLRLPPNSLEAERAVLGGLLLDAKAWERIADKLIEEDFYRKDHRLIFRAIAQLQNQDKPSDVLTVAEWLEGQDMEHDTGGLVVLSDLANGVPSSANIAAYAEIVREKSVLRELIDAGSSITESGYQPEGKESRILLEEAESSVFQIAERHARGKSDFVSIHKALKDTMHRLVKLAEQESSITGLPTGFNDFDMKTAGLQNSDLIIVAGRPAMGKTTFAMNIAEYAAIKEKETVLVFSMEMPAIQLMTRLLSSLCRIEMNNLRTGNLTDDDWPMLQKYVTTELHDVKLFVDETASLSPNEIRSRARRVKREHGLGLIVVDYIQLMQVPGFKENRTQEIAEISRGLKAMAKELDVPVIALSQLNRSVDSRTDKRPVMSDLRESGSIEQDADVICFIYRDEVYNPESKQKGKAEIIIGKQRNGETGKVGLTFQGKFTRFDNFTPDFYNDAME